ncbi:MAG: response regulator [Oceanospirillaceae bacterium]|nr:response regulator [Oceanospirillaceae bacterium]
MTDVFTTKENTKKTVSTLARKRVLIVEDMSEMRQMLRSMMIALGYTNIEVEPSGQNALRQVLDRHYDIILSDFNLGGSVDGQQILEASRKSNTSDHSTIFIMITADTAYESVVSVLEYQPDSYLVKPFTPAAFQRRFNRVKLQKKVFSDINKNRKDSNYEAMENQAQAIEKQYPQYSSLCLKVIGESLFLRGAYKSAKKHYLKVIKNHHNLAWAYFGLAQCELKLDHPLAAVDNLEKTISLSRHFLSAYDALADAHEELDNPEGAQAAMKDALEVSPRSIERSKRLGQISEKIKDWKTAEQAYSRIIRLTKETNQEKVEFYYDHLKCLTSMIQHQEHDIKNTEKIKRSLFRLRILGKDKPIVVTNSFRVEVQQHLYRDRLGDAIKSWKQWKHLIESGRASPISNAQEITIKKKLGLL